MKRTLADADAHLRPVFRKYLSMLKAGLPEGAVRHKMTSDNVPDTEIELFFAAADIGGGENANGDNRVSGGAAAPPARPAVVPPTMPMHIAPAPTGARAGLLSAIAGGVELRATPASNISSGSGSSDTGQNGTPQNALLSQIRAGSFTLRRRYVLRRPAACDNPFSSHSLWLYLVTHPLLVCCIFFSRDTTHNLMLQARC